MKQVRYTALPRSGSRSVRSPQRKKPLLPTRYTLVLMLFWAFFMLYSLRVNLSVAIVAMVNLTALESALPPTIDPLLETCPRNVSQDPLPSSSRLATPDYVGEFNWDENTQGMILGAFFYGYVLTQLPGGRLAELIGAKWLLGCGILWTSVLSLVTPFAARVWGARGLVLVRILQGLCEGVVFPSSMALLSHWAPKHERSRIISYNTIGTSMGTVVTLVVTGQFCSQQNGWPNVFYVFGGAGCIWFMFWALLVHERPESHPRISKHELNYIQNTRGYVAGHRGNLPWRAILTSSAVWSLAVTIFCGNYGFYFLLIDLPNYLSGVLHYKISNNGFQNALVHLSCSLSMLLLAPVADSLRKKRLCPTTRIRKSFQMVGLMGPAICLALVPWAGCDHMYVMTLLVAGMSLYAFTVGGQNPMPLDMAPNFAGTLMGITNGFGNLSGMAAPLITGWLIQHNDTLAQWRKLFLLASAIYSFGAVQFALFGSAELQPWAAPTDKVELFGDESAASDHEALHLT
ncbi:sialin-like [Varroa jacobsoni]|uniref:sialin-like n=1 Tax=Varroa jacobsoni TaxID=62625 RepID=UPI000BF26A11|nr:sialin-like [Varroa jacobsoni]XP_022699624.1 sialin-like [Varroa jacobsoni]XP_022699629.1 sialin-like [Varroa jacobsoni]XP_022699633.1 sialin-like [Varroa jacobsoni]